MNRPRNWSLGGLLLVAALAGCGGVGTTEVGTAAQQLTAPPWMAELDLPGCADLEAGQCQSWRVLGHPHHADLAIATAVDLPLCVDTRAGVLEAATRLNAEVTIPTIATTPHPTAAAWPGDDPIPLGKEQGSEAVRAEGDGAEQQGGVEDDPIPLGKGGSEQETGSEETEDEPIPLAKVSSPSYNSVVPHDNIAMVDGRRLTPVAPAGTTPP